MKKIFAIVLATLTLVGVASAQQTTISRFEGKKITGVDVSGAFKINIRQGSDTKAVLSIPQRFEKQLVFKMGLDGVLEIRFEGNINSKNNEYFTADIVCSSLNSVDLSGACKLLGEGTFSANDLKFDMSGATNVSIPGNISASGSLVSFEMSGASKIVANITSNSKLDIDTSGSSHMELSGTAASAVIEVSGASKMDLENMVVKTMSIDGSGASNLTVNVSEKLDVDASGATKVRYKGQPKLSMDTSGSASVSSL